MYTNKIFSPKIAHITSTSHIPKNNTNIFNLEMSKKHLEKLGKAGCELPDQI